MNSVSESLKGVFQNNVHPVAIRVTAIHAETPTESLPDLPCDLSAAHEQLTVPLRFQFQHDSGSYALNLDYLGLVRLFKGIVRIPSPCCLDLLQGKTAQIETQIERQTKSKQWLRKQEGLPQILTPLIEALIEAHYSKLEFALYTSRTHFKLITGFRQLVEELRKNPKGYQLKKITVQGSVSGSIPWLEGRTLANQELSHLRDALIPFKKRAPSEKEMRDLACRLLFAPAVSDMDSYIQTHATALRGVTTSFRLIPKSGQGEELSDGYEIHCKDIQNRSHRLILFEGKAPPAKAHFQALSLEFNAQDRFAWQASPQAQKDIRENVLRWIDCENSSPDDWALHQAFQILGKRSASDQEEQHLLEKMAEASEKAGFVTFLGRSLRQAIRECEMSPVQASTYIFNAMLALPEWLLKQETSQVRDILNGSETSLGEAVGKGAVRLEVLKCILPLCLWRHPEAHLLPNGTGFKIWVELDGLPLLLKFSPAEALQGLARLQPLLEEEEKLVQRFRKSCILTEGPILTVLASAKSEAAELVSHADSYVKGFAKELLLINVVSSPSPEAFFSLLKALPDLLEGENDPEVRKQITHLTMQRLLAYFDQRLPLLKAAEFASCLTILSEGIQMFRAEMVQILSRSLSAMGDPALGAAAAELRQFSKQPSQAVSESPIIPNGLQDIVVQRVSAKNPEDILQLLQELNRAISETTDSSQDTTLADWIDKAAAKAAPLLKANLSLQQELLKLYRNASAILFKRRESLKALSTLLALPMPEALVLAVDIAKERLERPLPPAIDQLQDPYYRLICELCKKEEEASYVKALEFFGAPAVAQRMSPQIREEIEALLIATRLALLSQSDAEALHSAAFLEVKRFLSSPRPLALRQQCLKAVMQVLAGFFRLPEQQLLTFQNAWELLKEMERQAFLLTGIVSLRTESLRNDNNWINLWLKSEAIQAASFEVSPLFFFRSFVAGFLSYMGERYRTDTVIQESAQQLANLGKTEIEESFGDFKIMAQDAGDFACALQALLEQVVKIRTDRIEIQALLLGVGSSCLMTLLDKLSGVDPNRFLLLLQEYAFWPLVTFPFLVNLHEHYLKAIVQRADERKWFRNTPVLRFQLHFLAGEPLKPVPVLQKQRFQSEIQNLLDKLQMVECHAGRIRQFHLLLRLAREFGQEYSFKHLYAAFFVVISREEGWGRVKLLRQLCRDAVLLATERAAAMSPVMAVVEPLLLHQWLTILRENPQPPPEDNEGLSDMVRSYLAELLGIWDEACPTPVADGYRSVFFALIDRRKKEIAAVDANIAPTKMAAFCTKFACEYEKWSASKKVEQTGERLFEEWVEVCAKVRAHTSSSSFQLAAAEQKQKLLQCYVSLVEMGIILMPSGGAAYRQTVEEVFEVIESNGLHVSMTEEQFYHLFWLLAQPTHKSSCLSAEEKEARVASVKTWMRRLQALNLDAINRACRHLLEGNLAKEIFKLHPEHLEQLKTLFKI